MGASWIDKYKLKVMAYLYRHIRLDKNQPFYIGIGSDDKGKYERANTRTKRNNLWHKIAAKTKYEVEILIDGMDWYEACKKEQEFIKLYGRINNDTGILANLTDGGSGAPGVIMPKDVIQKDIERKSVPIAQYDTNGKFITWFPSLRAAALAMGRKKYINFLHYKTKPLFALGYFWKAYLNDNSNIYIEPKRGFCSFDKNGDFIKSYRTVKEVCEDLKLSETAVYLLLEGKHKSTEGSIRIRKDTGDRSNIGFYEYRYNGYLSKGKTRSENSRSKPVIQFDRHTGEILGKYACADDAKDAIGLKSRTNISCCCTGKLKSAGGYVWKYANDNE